MTIYNTADARLTVRMLASVAYINISAECHNVAEPSTAASRNSSFNELINIVPEFCVPKLKMFRD
jgi:hypothetical protein